MLEYRELYFGHGIVGSDHDFIGVHGESWAFGECYGGLDWEWVLECLLLEVH